MCKAATRMRADGGENLLFHHVQIFIARSFKCLDQSRCPEEIVVCIRGFNHAVSVKKQPVARLERHMIPHLLTDTRLP